MDKVSQCQRLLDYMKQKPVSSYSAMVDLGIASLHRRLTDLRSRGHVIADEWITKNDVKYKQYRLIK